DIQRLIRKEIPVIKEHPFMGAALPEPRQQPSYGHAPSHGHGQSQGHAHAPRTPHSDHGHRREGQPQGGHGGQSRPAGQGFGRPQGGGGGGGGRSFGRQRRGSFSSR